MENIFWLFYAAVHMTAGLLEIFLITILCGAQYAGPVIWSVPAACFVLPFLDLTGRIRLGRPAVKLVAAFAIPALCGCVAVLTGGWLPQSLELEICFLSLLLLAIYILFRKEKPAEEAAPLTRAEALLELGCDFGLVQTGWLVLLGSGVVFMATFGFLFTIILGSLIASKNDLWDYNGLMGVLLGLIIIQLYQSLAFRRGIKLARQGNPWLNTEDLRFALFIPIWNTVQARRLQRELRERRLKGEGSP